MQNKNQADSCQQSQQNVYSDFDALANDNEPKDNCDTQNRDSSSGIPNYRDTEAIAHLDDKRERQSGPIHYNIDKEKAERIQQEKLHADRLIATYALNIIDCGYTIYFAARFGVEIESNQFALSLWTQNPVVLVLVKLFGVGAALLFLYIARKNRGAVFAGKMLLLIYSLLVLYHIVLLVLAIMNNGF